jgi:hypothetical protein
MLQGSACTVSRPYHLLVNGQPAGKRKGYPTFKAARRDAKLLSRMGIVHIMERYTGSITKEIVTARPRKLAETSTGDA